MSAAIANVDQGADPLVSAADAAVAASGDAEAMWIGGLTRGPATLLTVTPCVAGPGGVDVGGPPLSEIHDARRLPASRRQGVT